ncbi:Transcription initiation factor TFIID subunit 9 [Trapelia coarctata]|nr:Transcription initiation factor TFIID subunit 9 [Trapelia coarctata]
MATNGATTDPPSSDPQPATLTPPPAANHITTISTDPSFPSTSLRDDGLAKRPRDARLIHMILANAGITAYQERVPLQLMDFAYRYTSSTLQDALHLTSESYGAAVPAGGAGRGAGGAAAAGDGSSVTLQGLRLSVASRTHYQFSPQLPKEFYQELAAEKNRVALPLVGRDWGNRLPPERYCLTGVGWGLRDEWDSDGETVAEDGEKVEAGGDVVMDTGEGGDEGDERMEDFFGDDMGGEDKDMEDQ